jgi:hypothetical protein
VAGISTQHQPVFRSKLSLPVGWLWILYEEENQEAATSSSSLFQISAFNFLLFFNPGRAMPPHLSADLLVICDWYQ